MDRTWLLFTAAAFSMDKSVRREVERVIERERGREERFAAVVTGPYARIDLDEKSACSCHPTGPG